MILNGCIFVFLLIFTLHKFCFRNLVWVEELSMASIYSLREIGFFSLECTQVQFRPKMCMLMLFYCILSPATRSKQCGVMKLLHYIPLYHIWWFLSFLAAGQWLFSFFLQVSSFFSCFNFSRDDDVFLVMPKGSLDSKYSFFHLIGSETSLWACLSICQLAGWSVCHDFLKGQEVSLPWSNQSTWS